MMTDQDILTQLQKIVEKSLPDIIRNGNNSIRDAVVASLDLATRTCSVTILGTGEILGNIKYIANTDNPQVGMYCQLISSDPKLGARVKAYIIN